MECYFPLAYEAQNKQIYIYIYIIFSHMLLEPVRTSFRGKLRVGKSGILDYVVLVSSPYLDLTLPPCIYIQ